MAREHQTSRGITGLPESGRSRTSQKGQEATVAARSELTVSPIHFGHGKEKYLPLGTSDAA
jgi:hypothetical protein